MNRNKRVESSRLESERLERWLAAVEQMLRDQLGPDGRDETRPNGLNYRVMSATIVGMFEAGARDSEVVEFLRYTEHLSSSGSLLGDDARRELVSRLHRTAAQI